jgi:hypothetical protein
MFKLQCYIVFQEANSLKIAYESYGVKHALVNPFLLKNVCNIDPEYKFSHQ